ncbi:MAG: GFA family protein [Candidatus Marinimicrobia bacterium]|nr:GFA family protein [Candidatus Neomarinimicrobiota bacterium]
MKQSEIQGGCYCGKIRYQFTCDPHLSVNCHCNNCRRAVGAQSVAWIILKKETFSWIKGNPTRYKTDTKAWRTFCQDCGSSLTYESPTRTNDIDIASGSLDNPEKFPPTEDAYINYRIPWVHKIKHHE